MSELYQSLSHSKWDCKYHLVGTSINSKFEVRVLLQIIQELAKFGIVKLMTSDRFEAIFPGSSPIISSLCNCVCTSQHKPTIHSLPHHLSVL